MPALYQAFSRREVFIALLDARAGSPPTARSLWARYPPGSAGLERWFREAEQWSGELLETTLSYPVLGYFRSQHDRQSWVAALTLVLDISALALCLPDVAFHDSARLTFAMARHTAVDMTQVLGLRLDGVVPDRAALEAVLVMLGLEEAGSADLAPLRAQYEPYLVALSTGLVMPLPAWLTEGHDADDWETTAE